MRRLRDLKRYPDGSFGAKIAPDAEPEPVGSILPAADPQFVEWASGFWPQADESEFEWGLPKMRVRHRETGVMYAIRPGLPFGGELASGISVFIVRDGRLILLADKSDRPLHQTAPATVSARRVEYVAPEEGRIW